MSVVWWCAAGAVPPAGDQHLHHNRKVSAWTRRRCRPITGRRGQAGRRRRAVIGRRVAAAGWAGQAVSQCGAVSWQCFSRTVGSSQWTAPGSHYSPVSAGIVTLYTRDRDSVTSARPRSSGTTTLIFKCPHHIPAAAWLPLQSGYSHISTFGHKLNWRNMTFKPN